MWSSRHWVPEIWTWLDPLKSQKAKYVSPHFYIFMENLYFFSNCTGKICNFPSWACHWRPWMILIDFSPLLISMILLLFSQTVSDEDLFKGWWKLHFQENSFPLPLWLFMKWAPSLRIRCKFRGKNKQESWHRCLFAKLIKISSSSFRLLPICVLCMYVCVLSVIWKQ